MARHRRDQGATDPLLVIAAIAVSLVLLVGGSFAVAGVLDNGRDLNARTDLDKVATAESAAVAAGPSAPSWTGATDASASVEGSRRNDIVNPHLRTGRSGWATMANVSTGWEAANGGRITLVSSSGVDPGQTYTSTAEMPITPGERRSAALNVTNTGTVTFRVNAMINPRGTASSWAVGGSVTLNPGDTRVVHVDNVTMPAGTTSYLVLLRSNSLTPGAAAAIDWAISEDTPVVTSYFDGTTPSRPGTYLPYLSDAGDLAVDSALRPAGGTIGRALETFDVGFTPSDDTRIAVLTDAAGTGWAAVAESTTGKLYLRTSASAATGELIGSSGNRTPATRVPLPAGLTITDVNAALTNAGGF